MEDRRKYSRLNWSVEVRWKKCSDARDESLDNATISKDISAGGIRIIFRDEVRIGDKIDLEIKFGGGRDIRASGRVAWAEAFKISGDKEEIGYEAGIEFLDMPEDTRLFINSFIMKSKGIK